MVPGLLQHFLMFSEGTISAISSISNGKTFSMCCTRPHSQPLSDEFGTCWESLEQLSPEERLCSPGLGGLA